MHVLDCYTQQLRLAEVGDGEVGIMMAAEVLLLCAALDGPSITLLPRECQKQDVPRDEQRCRVRRVASEDFARSSAARPPRLLLPSALPSCAVAVAAAAQASAKLIAGLTPAMKELRRVGMREPRRLSRRRGPFPATLLFFSS